MNTDTVITIGNEALMLTVAIAAPLLMSALAVGLLVGLFQAATQINEVTLSFIPKLLALVTALYLTGPWILTVLLDYTTRLIQDIIPGTIG
ncbi:MAG: flagellar biosynthesis protein FliQ [Pseudomonadota bacterium]